MDNTSKFAIRTALELTAMKLDALDRRSRLIGSLVRSKDDATRSELIDLWVGLDIELGEVNEIICNALLVSKGNEPEV